MSFETRKLAEDKKQMKKIKAKILLISLLFIAMVLTILVIPSVSAGGGDNVTIETPAASGNIVCGSQDINVTVNGSITIGDLAFNLSFYVQSASTANSSWVPVGTNTSVNFTLVKNSTIRAIDFSAIRVEDSNDYILNVTVVIEGNGSYVGDDIKTGMTVDCTIPAAATSLGPTDNSIDTDGSVTFNGTVIGRNTTSCTLEFVGTNFGGPSQAMTHTGNTCSLTLNNIPEQTYNWYITASDETNTTNSSEQTITVDIGTGSSKILALLEEPGVRSTGGATLSIGGGIMGGDIGGVPTIVFVLVAFVGIIWWVRVRK